MTSYHPYVGEIGKNLFFLENVTFIFSSTFIPFFWSYNLVGIGIFGCKSTKVSSKPQTWDILPVFIIIYLKKWPQKYVLVEFCLNYSLHIWKNGRIIRFQANYIHFINYIGSKNLVGKLTPWFTTYIRRDRLEAPIPTRLTFSQL